MKRSIVMSIATWAGACGGAAPTPAPAPAPARDVAPDFGYDASAPLDVQAAGAPEIFGDVRIAAITYARPRGGRVPALVVEPVAAAGGARRPAVILQHGMGAIDKSNLLPDAVLLARAGAVALLPDAPDQRPAALRALDFAGHEHDPELWQQAAVDLRRAVDVLAARDDVDGERLGFAGHSFGATMGCILAAGEPRLRAFALIAPGAMTASIREGQTADLIALRANIPPAALAGYLAQMAPYDAPVWLARAPATAAILVQHAAFDPGVPDAARRAIDAAAPAAERRRYPTGHFITSPAAMRDRLDFFTRTLGLPAAGDAFARELAAP